MFHRNGKFHKKRVYKDQKQSRFCFSYADFRKRKGVSFREEPSILHSKGNNGEGKLKQNRHRVNLGFMSGFEILSEVWIWAIIKEQKMFPNINSYSQGMKISSILDSWNQESWRFLNSIWRLKELKMFPHKNMISNFLEESLVRFWRFPILQVGKRIHFLFFP